MHSLEWVHASLTEVENEIPELELAMAVYRRLTGDGEEPGRTVPRRHGGARPQGSRRPPRRRRRPSEEATSRRTAEAGPAPSFSQFAMAHLDPATEATDAGPASNGTA